MNNRAIVARALSVCAVVALASSSAFAQGRIIAIGDEWLLSDFSFTNQTSQTQQLASNIAGYFGGAASQFAVFSTTVPLSLGGRGTNNASLASYMTSLGHTWSINPAGTFTLANLQQYNGVFVDGAAVGGNAASVSVLTQYVQGGGNVLVMAGTGDIGGAVGEANAWNPFLNTFGLAFGSEYFAVGSSLLQIPAVPTAHPLGSLVSSVTWGFGQTALDIDLSNPLNEVALHGNFTGFSPLPTSGNPAALPIIATYNIPAPAAAALLPLLGLISRRRR